MLTPVMCVCHDHRMILAEMLRQLGGDSRAT
jgi:hypothetical protein